MTSRERINTELDKLSDRELNDLYPIVEQFIKEKMNSRKSGIMSRLRQIRIKAPEDFSENLDSYLNGEKQLPE